MLTLFVYFVAIVWIKTDAEILQVSINKKTLKMNLCVGLLVIGSYTVECGSKLILLMYTQRDNAIFWADVVECIAALGFFAAFVMLVDIIQNYAEITS